MARFSKNVISQVSGFDNPILAGELVYNQKTFWNVTIQRSDGTSVDLTGASIDAQIIRRSVTNIIDTRNGLQFDIADYSPPPSPVNLTISNIVPASGQFTLVIDESAWSVISSDPELDIAANNCVGFSGRIKIAFPAVGTTPADDTIMFLLFLVRSDGVTN